MHIAYSPYFSQIYKFSLLFSFFLVFWGFHPTLTIMHLRVMLNTYRNPLLTVLTALRLHFIISLFIYSYFNYKNCNNDNDGTVIMAAHCLWMHVRPFYLSDFLTCLDLLLTALPYLPWYLLTALPYLPWFASHCLTLSALVCFSLPCLTCLGLNLTVLPCLPWFASHSLTLPALVYISLPYLTYLCLLLSALPYLCCFALCCPTFLCLLNLTCSGFLS